jgi:hypothetical protein
MSSLFLTIVPCAERLMLTQPHLALRRLEVHRYFTETREAQK